MPKFIVESVERYEVHVKRVVEASIPEDAQKLVRSNQYGIESQPLKVNAGQAESAQLYAYSREIQTMSATLKMDAEVLAADLAPLLAGTLSKTSSWQSQASFRIVVASGKPEVGNFVIEPYVRTSYYRGANRAYVGFRIQLTTGATYYVDPKNGNLLRQQVEPERIMFVLTTHDYAKQLAKFAKLLKNAIACGKSIYPGIPGGDGQGGSLDVCKKCPQQLACLAARSKPA